MRAGIVKAQFNLRYTEALKSGALDYLKKNNISDTVCLDVPGAFELGLGAQELIMQKKCDFVICLGVVVRGETAHFDYVCKAAQEACLQVSLKTSKPVSFGVLTVNTYQQLYDRIWGKLGNNGAHAAKAAHEMFISLNNIKES